MSEASTADIVQWALRHQTVVPGFMWFVLVAGALVWMHVAIRWWCQSIST